MRLWKPIGYSEPLLIRILIEIQDLRKHIPPLVIPDSDRESHEYSVTVASLCLRLQTFVKLNKQVMGTSNNWSFDSNTRQEKKIAYGLQSKQN
jgi:hypothetical protein